MDGLENKQLSEVVDDLFAESDRRAFEVLHRIAALACAQVIDKIEQVC